MSLAAARSVLVALFAVPLLYPATFGTVVPIIGGAADLVLDEPRGRVYFVNSSQTRIEVYSIRDRRFLAPVRTDALPLSAAMSRDGRFLYIACFDASALNVIDLDTMTRSTVSLPAKPEGIAVGGDERVLISTIGTGQNNASNILLIYDPSASETRSVTSVLITPPAPLNPLLPPPSGRVFLASRAQMVTSRDGGTIVGINIPNAGARVVFVYEVASQTVLRSRTIANASSVLSISPDGSKFMAGLTLFETATLSVLAQQNTANAPYPFPVGANFNVQQNQGGSVFAPDGSVLFSAFNIAPVQTPPARANVSQLMVNDPDNLLIRMGLQLPENLSGKMVASGDGSMIFALSESGFLILPMSNMQQSAIAVADTGVSLLLSDQCGAFNANRTGSVGIRNAGRGRLTVNATLLQTTTVSGGLGGAGGPGGGAPGGGVVTANPSTATAPALRSRPTPDGAQVDLTFTTAAAARTPGTVSPAHTFVLQSEEAINIPPALRVLQNFRNAEAQGEIIPIDVGLSPNEGLEDLVMDNGRQRLYIANSGKNRVEVFDIRRRELLSPIRVGQLPRSLAMSPDGSTLYVANSGSEYISVIDLGRLEVSGRILFPPLPFNSGAVPMYPSVIAAGVRGPQIVMNNGTIWKVVGDGAVPRAVSPAIGTSVIAAPRSMAATPNGEYILLLAGNGFVYLYDSIADEFVQGRQVATAPIQGFFGPVAAGPRGQFYLANGFVLNQSLTPVGSAGTTPQPGPVRPGVPVPDLSRPIAAVATGQGTQFVRFAQPVRTAATTVPAEPPSIELVDANTGNTIRTVPALEGPLSTQVGTTRVNVNGRTLAMDPAGTAAYALTTSGISIVPLAPANPADRPAVNPNGTVSLSSYVPSFAPGSLVSIFGRNLGSSAVLESSVAPTLMGGTCVTINNAPMPLLMTSPGQINAQVPVELAAGRYPMIVRSAERQSASLVQNVTVARYAPAVFTDPGTKHALIFRPDGSLVTRDRPARRDEPLMLYATGLGRTSGGRVLSGQGAPSDPLAETDEVKVFFGDPTWRQAEMIVEWSGLVPGLIGVYQINIRVPGDRMRGEELPVTVRVGGIDSQKTGPVVPVVAVQ